MIIKFKNWEKFNPRNDAKGSTWLRLQNNLYTRPLWEKLKPDEFKFFIFMLCMAGQNENKGFFEFNEPLHTRLAAVKPSVSNRTIQKLVELQVIERRTIVGTYATNERTVRTDVISLPPVANFDFEILYKKYPRKEGKKKGLVICKVQIKNQEGFDSLSKAIDRYAEHCRKNATEPKFIKHFSTFMASWQDWLDPETGKTLESTPPLSYMARKLQENAK